MKTTGRYEVREVLGEGGMGVVYRAYDPVMSRDVTVKTIRNPQDRTALDLFRRECSVLASLAHPNIVEIHDVGETEEGGSKRPYFVMPYLRGATLDQLIKSSSARLTVDRSIQIIAQVCRGLQAAHEQGLVHRDLKPSNIFVLEDDSVKVIDFGVAHLVDQHTSTGLKGTLLYMAPEQLLMKPPTPLSDQFAVAVVCYEMLAHKHPFNVPGYKDLAQAILTHSPTPVSDLNQSVSRLISQVLHKALAKEPIHRYANVREFADYLQRALRNEPLEIFDPAKIEPRMERARKAAEAGDLEFAAEILQELRSESYLNPEIDQLYTSVEESRRQKTIQALLETARRRFDEEEYLMALQKIQEILNIEPGHTDAVTLKGAVESKRSTAQVEGSLRLAQQHLENNAFDLARQAVEKVLQLRPKDTRAQALLAEADRRDQESMRARQEKEKAYQSALQAVGQGEVSAALSKLERVLELDRRSPDNTSASHSTAYQKLYEEVRSKRDHLEAQHAEAKKLFSERNLSGALAVCEEVLKAYPGNVVFQSLKFDIEEASREETSLFIATTEKEVSAEPNLDRKVALLEAAWEKYPQEDRFKQALERMRSRRDLVQSIAGRAEAFENSGQYGEALSQWEILRNMYPQYPGLDVEMERLRHRREQQSRTDAKAQWITQIDQALGMHRYAKALSLSDEGLSEFPQDAELLSLKKAAQLGLKRSEDAAEKLAAGQELLQSGKIDEGFAQLRESAKLDPQSQVARATLVEALLQRARALFDTDWRGADAYVHEAHELDPGNPLAKSLRTLIQDRRENEEITASLSRARELQGQNNLSAAIRELDLTLAKYPGRDRLVHLRASLVDGLPEMERAQLRMKDLFELNRLAEESHGMTDPKELEAIFAKTRVYRTRYSGDTDFMSAMTIIENRAPKTPEPVNDKGMAATVPAIAAIQPNPPVAEVKAAPVAAAPALAVAAAAPAKPKSTVPFYKTVWGKTAVVTGALLVTAVIVTELRMSEKSTAPKVEAKAPAQQTLTRVVLSGATGHARILDAKSQDVTNQLAAGLPEGTYTLVDNKDGFHPVQQQFQVDGTHGPEQKVVASWQTLPATLAIEPVASGTWTLDGKPLDGAQLAKSDIGEAGAHELTWSDGHAEAKLPITVTDGRTELGEWSSHGGAGFGLAVSLGPNGGSLRRLNVKRVKYQAGTATPEEVNADGAITAPAQADDLTFQAARDGSVIGKTGPFDASKGELVYVFFTPQRAASATTATKPAGEPGTSAAAKPATNPAPPAVTAQPAPALTPEEIRRKKLEKLGLSPDDIQSKEKK